MNNNDIKYMIVIAAIAIIFFAFGYFAAPNNINIAKQLDNMNNELNNRVINAVKFDTLYKYIEIEKPTIRFKEVAKIQYIQDTLYLTNPFIATLDTVLDLDTINVNYTFPANLFELKLAFKKDSIKTNEIYVTRYETKVVERPMWLDILSHTGASLFGFSIGYISK